MQSLDSVFVLNCACFLRNPQCREACLQNRQPICSHAILWGNHTVYYMTVEGIRTIESVWGIDWMLLLCLSLVNLARCQSSGRFAGRGCRIGASMIVSIGMYILKAHLAQCQETSRSFATFARRDCDSSCVTLSGSVIVWLSDVPAKHIEVYLMQQDLNVRDILIRSLIDGIIRKLAWLYITLRLNAVADSEPLPTDFAGKHLPTVALVSRFLNRIYRCIDRFLVGLPYHFQGQCVFSRP